MVKYLESKFFTTEHQFDMVTVYGVLSTFLRGKMEQLGRSK
jgi:hypothetical protein